MIKTDLQHSRERKHSRERLFQFSRAFLEDAEERATATAELCIACPQPIEAPFDIREFGMQLKDRRLEIVSEFVGPSVDRLSYNLSAALFRLSGNNMRERLAGRNGHSRFHDGHVTTP